MSAGSGFVTASRRSKAILFGVAEHGDQRSSQEVLEELSELADTGNFEIVGHLAQHRRHPDPNYYLGRGKLDELEAFVETAGADTVICDDPLSPAQGRNIEKALNGIGVMDRSELILHIFGTHARSTQAKLQVELARLQYQMPRLKRLWTHLERQRGGIGVRGGAGEKQIDLDRSELRTKLSRTKRRLDEIAKRKQREVRSRAEVFTAACVGYTNAGKSTLMNRLTDAGVLSENRLFSTLDTRTKPWRLPGGRLVLLSDTVGFIKKLPHQLVASFHATLEEALNADLLLLVIDGSNPAAIDHLRTVEQVIDHLGAQDIPRLYVINKHDQIDDMSLLAPIYRHGGESVVVSAKTGYGLDGLADAVFDHMAQTDRDVDVLVPHTAGRLHGEIRAMSTIVEENFEEDGCHMRLRISPESLGRLLSRGAQVLREH